MKQVIILRKDLNMRKGKMVAQGAHASIAAILANDKIKDNACISEWLEGNHTKIVVSVDSLEKLVNLYERAKEKGLNCSIITDLGFTEFKGIPTETAVAIGPNYPEDVDEITKDLPLL